MVGEATRMGVAAELFHRTPSRRFHRFAKSSHASGDSGL